MDIKNAFNKGEKTADYFIKNKVQDMIERSVKEGKKREQLAGAVSEACADPNTEEGKAFLGSIADFSIFPKYVGRGMQENAPDIDGSLLTSGKATLTMRFSGVEETEYEKLIKDIEAAGFEKNGSDYVKDTDTAVYTMSVSFSADKLRVFHMIQKKA